MRVLCRPEESGAMVTVVCGLFGLLHYCALLLYCRAVLYLFGWNVKGDYYNIVIYLKICNIVQGLLL